MAGRAYSRLVTRMTDPLGDYAPVGRYAIHGVTGLVGLVVALFLVLLLVLQFGSVRNAIADRALQALRDAEVAVDIGSYDGLWPVSLGLRDVRVHDAKGDIATIGHVGVSWSPWALLGGTVHVTSLDLDDVHVLRLPEGGEDDTSSGGPLLPSLPVSVIVDRLSAPQVTLDAPVAGEHAVLSLEGNAALTGTQAVLQLTAARTDGGTFDLDTDIAFQPADNRADFNISLTDGAPGRPGLVAAMTGDGALAQVRIDATSEGPASAWRGEVDAALGAYGDLTGSASGDWRADGAVDLDYRLVPGSAAGLDSPVDLKAVLARFDDGFALRDVVASGEGLSFDGRLSVERLSRRPHLTLSGDASGLPYPADMRELLPETFSVSADATFDTAFSQAAVSQLSVEAPGQSIRFEGDVDLSGETSLSGKLSAQLDEARPYLAMADIGASGPLTLDADLGRLTTSGEMAGTVSAKFLPRAFDDPALAALVGEALTLDGEFADADEGRTRIEDLVLATASGAVTLSASGELGGDAADLSLSASVPDASALNAVAGVSLSGSVAADATLAGPWDGLRTVAKLSLADGSVEGTPVSGEFSGDISLSPLAGPVSFDGTVDGQPAHVSALLRSEEQTVFLDDMIVDGAGLEAKGALNVSQAGGVRGRLEGDIRSLGPAGSLAGTALEGHGPFNLALAPTDKGFSAKLDATLRTFGVADAVTARQADLDVTYAEVDGLFAVASMKGVEAGGASFSSLTLKATGPFDRLALSASGDEADVIEGSGGGDRLAFDAVLVTPESKLDLEGLEARLAGSAISLQSPATISYGDGIAAGPLVLVVDDGSVALDATRRSNGLEARVEIQDLPARLVAALTGDPGAARGRLSGTAEMSVAGSNGSGAVHITFESEGGRMRGGQVLSPLPPLTVDGTWEAGKLSATLTTDAEGAEGLLVKVAMPLAARNGLPRVSRSAQLEASASGEADIGALWPLVPVDGHRLEGRLLLDVAATGPLNDLSISGKAAISNGLYENYDTGLLLSPLNAELEAQPPFGAKVTVKAGDGGSGQLSGEGRFDMSDEAPRRLDVKLDMNSFRVIRRDEGEAIASGTVDVAWPRGPGGKLEPVSIGGDIRIDRAEGNIPSQLPSDVVTLDVEEVNDAGKPVSPAGEAGKEDSESSGLRFDLNIEVPGRAFVRGRGLESEWQGKLKVEGSGQQPELTGRFTVVRGTFDFAGKRFIIAQGRIDFTGGKEIDPYITVSASHEADDYTATVNVSGPSSEPSFELTSVPDMPQEEILSRLLFGNGTGQLSALQAVQLAQATASLTGMMGGGTGLIDKLRKSLGVDVLSFGGNGDEGAVEVGRYVSEGVYVGVSQGLGPESGEVSVEVELTDDLSVESGFGRRGESSVGLTWERDY